MVNVTLTTQRVREVHFVNRLDKSGQIKLSSSFNFHVDYAADNTRCVASIRAPSTRTTPTSSSSPPKS